MAGKAILTCRTNSHPFQERTLNLEQPVKIGRSVARSRPAANNAIFDCKVLSRNHAVIWYANGKFFLQDTKSSNGTFVNNQRLSKSGEESNPREISSGDIVQFGVDVLENSRKVTHGCIIANLLLYLPDGKEAKASDTITVSFSKLIQVEDLYELHQYLQDAIQREHLLETKLLALQAILNNVRESAEYGWKALIAEDSLLTRVEALENQLQLYSKTFGEDKLKDDLKKLQEDKTEYQTTAKIFLKRILDEKLDVEQKHDEAKRSLVNLEAQCINLTEELSQSRTHIQELAQKLSEQTTRTEESDAKLQELQEQHIDSLGKLENKNQELENLLARQQTISIDRLAFEHQPKSLGDENEEDTNKENRISNIAVDESELKNSLETQAKSKEYLELIQAQRDLLRAQKLAYVQQLNDLQDENYLSKKQDVEEIEDRIEKLESHEAQVRSACDNFSSETKDEKEDVKRLTNGRDEVLEAKLKELKALHYEAKENKGPCENRTDLSNENIEIVKDGLRRTSAIFLITQENLEKAQKDYEESYLRSPTLAEPVKLKNEFLFIEGSDSQEIEDDVIRKEDEEISEKNPDESEHDEATLKHKKSESVSSEEPSSLGTEVDSYSTFESNKLLEELLLAQYNYSVSLKIIASMETEIENLKYDFSKLQTENKNLHKSYLLHEEREDLDDLDKKNPIDDREKLIVNLKNPDDQDEMKVDQTNSTDDRDEIKVDQNNPISDRDELIEKITNLEEKLVTLASQYMKCNDERLALSQQLSSASLDSPQPSLFNLLFTLPSVLLILALAVIFYPSLSHFMGTADFPEDHH